MVSKLTFVLLLITFFGSHILFERYFKKNGTKLKLKKIAIVGILVEAIMVFLAAHIQIFFYVLIYGTVIIASFISVFFRRKQEEDKLFKDAI